jgi:hypothetical protein
MTHLRSVTPALVRQVWDSMTNPTTRRVARKFRQAGRAVSHETVRRWRANGWRPLASEQHPLDAARAAIDDAIPVLTHDPLTTAESFVGASMMPGALEYLSDAELVRKASRELAIAVIAVAEAVTRQAAIVLTRPAEIATLLRITPESCRAIARRSHQAA